MLFNVYIAALVRTLLLHCFIMARQSRLSIDALQCEWAYREYVQHKILNHEIFMGDLLSIIEIYHDVASGSEIVPP